LASKVEQPIVVPPSVGPDVSPVADEVPARGLPAPLEEGEAEEREIEREYYGRLLAIRQLPRALRASARRAAREWRAAALKAVRMRRKLKRQAQYAARKSQLPPPQP
jgi:hypothetical protein